MNQTPTDGVERARRAHTPSFPRVALPDARKLESLTAAAQRLNCSPRMVRRMIAEGELTAYRVGKRMLRIDLNEVDALLVPVPAADAG